MECVIHGSKYPKEKMHEIFCSWTIRASEQRDLGLWRMVKWVEDHTCAGANIGREDRNVTSKNIATLIMAHIMKEPGYKVKHIQTAVHNHFQVNRFIWVLFIYFH